MLPYNTNLQCSALGLRNNINGILNDLRPNTMLMGVNQNPVASLIQPNSLQLSMNNNSNKDSQWLTLEVCREYQRSMCPRNELECKYAHPPSYIETQNGRVMCCYDSIKGKCHRIKPPCKYLHPPQHLKDLLIQNGKNNLLMKNLQMNIMQQQLSNFSGNTQSRLGFLSLTPQNSGIENQKLSATPEQSDSTSSSDQITNNKSLHDNCSVTSDVTHSQNNPYRFTNIYECQMTQCLPNNNSPSEPGSTSTIISNDNNFNDSKTSRKRPLPLNNTNLNRIESMDKPVPTKKIHLLETQLTGMTREQQGNQLGFLVNPLMAYQNQLASILSLNNQSGIQSNSLNLQALLASNNGGIMQLGAGLMCPNTLNYMNSFPMIPTMPNQHQLASSILQAANALQYNRSLAEFGGFQ